MTKSQARTYPPLVVPMLAMVAGTTVGWFLSLPVYVYLTAACVVLAAVFIFFRKTFFIFLISIIGFLWTCSHLTQIKTAPDINNHISNFTDGKTYLISGVVDSLPKNFGYKTRYIFNCQTLKNNDGPSLQVNGRILLTVYPSRNKLASWPLRYKDKIQITGQIRPIRNFSNPGTYDYETRMKFKRIFGSAYTSTEKIQKLDDHNTDLITRFLRQVQSVRERFYDKVKAVEHGDQKPELDIVTSQAQAVLVALITGQKEGISTETKDNFSKAGLSHILAISGLHMSLLALGFYTIFVNIFNRFAFLLVSGSARKLAGLLTLIPLTFYALFAGFSPSTQRALIMTIIFMAALLIEKEKDPLNSLCIAALAILIFDPTALFSISFQLSFSAVLFIILGFVLIYKMELMPANKWIVFLSAMVLTTIFAGLGTAPLVARYFNMVSFIQIFSNFILVPVFGFICLPLGFTGLLLMDIFPSISQLVLGLNVNIIALCLKLIQLISSMEWTWARVVTPSFLDIIFYYLCFPLIYLAIIKHRKTAIVLLILVIGFISISVYKRLQHRFSPGKLIVHTLDVGQGSATVIRTPEGKVLLIDGGGFPGRSNFDVGKFIVGPFLWRNWVKTIDSVILTHPESDHMKGLIFIFDNFKVKQWIRNRDNSNVKSFKALLTLAQMKKIPITFPDEDRSQYKFGQISLKILGSSKPSVTNDLNNNSLITRLSYKSFSMLFPGDIEKHREEQLAKELSSKLESVILVAPHHGSNTSSSKIFLDKVDPEGVIISCGYKNRYGFPHPLVVNRYQQMGIKLFRTDLMGAVKLTSSGDGYIIKTNRTY